MTSASEIIIKQPEPKSSRRKLFKLHSWVGFHLAFVMAIVLATGTIATVSNEIDWLIQSDMRVTPGKEKVSWQTMTDAVHEFAPSSTILTITDMKADYFAYRATVKNQYNQRQFVHVNQWTGEVTGTTGLITVQRVFRDLHRYLFMPSVIGLPVVGSMAFILLISLYTGLKTARNWKTLMTRVRINKGSRVLIGDAHKAAGLWGIWFIVLMSVSGIWYLTELGFEIGARVSNNDNITFEPPRVNLSEERLNTLGNIITRRSTDDIIEASKRAFPEITVHQIFFPDQPNKTINILGTRNNPILRPRANRLFLDPVSLEPLLIQRSEDISWVSWINQIADPLHFGFFGGLITKLIWFLFGLALTGLSITGVVLTWKRLKTKSVSKIQLRTLPVLFIALTFAYFYWYPLFNAPSKPDTELTFTKKTDKDFNIELHVGINKLNKLDGKIRLLAKADNANVNIKTVFIELETKEKTINGATKLKLKSFDSTSLYAANISPKLLNNADTLALTLELNTGEKVQANWQIDLHESHPN